MFFSNHLSKMLLITGFGTSTAFLYSFFPQWTVENIGRLPYQSSDLIFYQHWGMMVGLMGVMMMVSAFNSNWRSSILLYSLIEKAFMVFIVVQNISEPFSVGFYAASIMDSIVVLWTLGYYFEGRRCK